MALGQGLDALLPLEKSISTKDHHGNPTYVPVDSLAPNPYQPRRLFPEESLADLSNSIKEKGVIQPVLVRPTGTGMFEIVAGERRWRAARMAGFTSIPVIIRELSDSESLELSLIENLQRENLNPLDAAEAYETLIRKFSYTHEVLARRIGMDRTNITNHLRLLKLPDPIKEDLRQDRLSMGHARTLLALDSLTAQLRLSRKVVNHKLSVRDLERIVQNYKEKVKSAPTKAKEEDQEITALESALSRHLSTRVRVKTKSNESGKIEIHFHSRDELDRLLDIMGYAADFS